MLKNQKGFTLIEVLAALTITTLLIGAAAMLYQSVMHMYNNSMQHYSEHTEKQRVMTTITNKLSEASTAVFTGNDELRFNAGRDNYALVHSANDHTLTLYQFCASGTCPDAGLALADSSISLLSHPSYYSGGLRLSDEVSSISYGLTSGLNDFPTTPVSNGQLFYITVNFQHTFITATGAKQETTGEHDPKYQEVTAVKLLSDSTLK